MHGQRSVAVVGILAWGLVGACAPAGPKLVPVTGTVTVNNKPLERAEVSFIPDPSNKDVTPGSDFTGPDGNYKLRYQGRTGVAPGKYKVVISKKNEPTGIVLPESIKVDRVQQEMMGIRKETLPPSVSSYESSTEYVEVKETGENVFDFDVKVSTKAAAAKTP